MNLLHVSDHLLEWNAILDFCVLLQVGRAKLTANPIVDRLKFFVFRRRRLLGDLFLAHVSPYLEPAAAVAMTTELGSAASVNYKARRLIHGLSFYFTESLSLPLGKQL